MTPVVLLSPASGSGKTTVAAGLAQKLRSQNQACHLTRLGDDTSAASDAALFTRLSSGDGGLAFIEAPGAASSAAPEARALVVAGEEEDPAALAGFCREVGPRLAGVLLNRIPVKRRTAVEGGMKAAGVNVVLSLPEDRLLATPTLGAVAEALDAESLFFDSNAERALGGLVIASISADPGQGYFIRRDASAVIVRSDKPDLQLAAISAGATCLIVTGGLPFLSYVIDRAAADEIPLVRTRMDTGDTVKAIEGLYAAGPFSGGADKLSRLAQLFEGLDAAFLLAAA